MGIKALIIDGVRKRYSIGSTVSTVVGCSLRFLQFVFGIAVIGLYAQDLIRQRKDTGGFDPKWVRLLHSRSVSLSTYLSISNLPEKHSVKLNK